MEVFQRVIKNNYIFLAIAITSIAFVSLVYISSNKDIVDTDMYLKNGRWIVQLKEGKLDDSIIDKLTVNEELDIPRILYKMASTMIIPSDGNVNDTIEINKANLEAFQQGIYKYYSNTYSTEKSYLKSRVYKVVNSWMEGDFTNCVEVYNDCIQVLNIKSGKAIGLDFKNEY
ncbi:DUF6241 domain-containing protein [Paraclostridium sordellii]|uniref:Uncharacterized protein n=2 Tax=Paraclostridium sordellii TaxID=1505 RepID=A0A0C7QVL1_PARSO|nr:DUF6241 domain-containing protein [Paeniclostridium sordellii]QYE98973.1 hypothetical protein KZ987_05510 [Paeniclostridium sordellii]CEO06524.1 Uncharacterised protein [[Clostridium] sordellii] [Paeniclostridium sordellii]CEP86564.1 Uncharacterised protein [[Clostridium] sordellii] [Paeniclostridium sordellii]CEP96815.1 Uncharacterised protein [[Clostridium] sordellii] [Paeniclostridium sordellii]CEP99719.1 Uncharacterised protein [[Clostridium] sordellii] [Paeniclostridium sordellii]